MTKKKQDTETEPEPVETPKSEPVKSTLEP
jgi:hypothetical protein